MVKPTRPRTTSDDWYSYARDAFNKVVTEYLKHGKRAEASEQDHDCGHEFTITVVMRGHSSGVVSDNIPVHTDANYADTLVPVTVRAHDLKTALLMAAAVPLRNWFPKEDDSD